MSTTRFPSCLVFAMAAMLFAADGWCAQPIRLNATLVPNGDVSLSSLQLSHDGQSVLYLADQSIDGTNEAFVVPIGGGPPIKVSGPLLHGASVTSAQFSPDDERIVYRANGDDLRHIELFSTSVGGSVVKLNAPLPVFGNVGTTLLTDDGQVIYVADQDATSVLELYTVPIDGGDPIKISGPMASGGDAQVVDVDLDSGIVVYVADQEVDLRMEVYGATRDGSQWWKLNGPLQTTNSSVNVKGVRVTPGSEQVIYLADANQDEVFELFSVSAAGGDPVRLHPQLVNGGDVLANPIQISVFGDKVLYLADQEVDDVFEIFTVPVGGGPTTRVNGPLVAGGDVVEASLQFSIDGEDVLYIADQTANEVFELFVAPSAGGESRRLNGSLVSNGDVTAAGLSPNGERAVYIADRFANDVFELFSVSTAGGESVRLNDGLTMSRDVADFEITPDGEYVIYLADQEVDERFELYAAPIAGGDPLKLNSDLVSGGDVKSWLISPDSRRIVYYADQNVDEKYEIFSVSLFSQLSGDYNDDGTVDAADYTVWRDGLGGDYDLQDYADWKSSFGSGAASGNAAASAVPEPATWRLLACLLAWMAMPAQSRKSCSASRAGTYSSVT